MIDVARYTLNPGTPSGLSLDGQPLVGAVSSKGYIVFMHGRQQVRAHRVVFYLANGYWPEQVDHIDGNRLNNLPSNLRASDQIGNAQNKLGLGYTWRPRQRKWEAGIKVNNKRIYLGLHTTKEAAQAAYDLAKLRYHPTSGGTC